MPAKQPKILITAALPYANASIHIGHLVEYIQADIYARFLRMANRKVLYICASDTHGTPIEVNAQKLGVSPEEMVKKFNEEHKKDFSDFHILFDHYYTTHSKENKELSEFFFTTLNKRGYIHKKRINVIYCPKCARVLPDRYVKGTCPNCGTADQYGDICESCGLALKGTDLLNPHCSICNASPTQKESEHYFFKLSVFADKLREWLTKQPFQPEIRHHIEEWLNKGLEDWCISRDGPYFGFKIPEEINKYFYVWLDAPIGYISSTKHHTKQWAQYWKNPSTMASANSSVIHHFIGKDIIYFHFLFWPAMLMGVGFHVPDDITVHGFLTVNGKKMSKSRGTFFTAREFLNFYNPEYLRFYYALHLSKKLADVDLDFEDFQATINNKLIGNLANLCYRVLSFIEKNYGGKVTQLAKEPQLTKDIEASVMRIRDFYASLNIKDALAEILAISDKGNNYIQLAEPWKNKGSAKPKVGYAANLVRTLSILLTPILPIFAMAIQAQLGEKDLSFKDIRFNKKLSVKNTKIILTKVETIPKRMTFPLNLVVAKIISVKDHPNADSLYVLDTDCGTEKRQLVAGLKKHFSKEAIINKHIVLCTNIVPATIRGIQSNGMLLAADDGATVAPLEAPKSPTGASVTMEGYQNSSAQITFEALRKLNIRVSNGKVVWEGTHLKTDTENISVSGVRDGAEVR